MAREEKKEKAADMEAEKRRGIREQGRNEEKRGTRWRGEARQG